MGSIGIALPPAPVGLVARYFGGGVVAATSRYYWVRANYPSGKSQLRGPALVVTSAGLSKDNSVLLTWEPCPGAISYDVLQTTTTTRPTTTATILNEAGLDKNSYTDIGITLTSYNPFGAPELIQGSQIAHARYVFPTDSGVVGTVTPVQTVEIPANAIITGGTVNVTTAVTSAGATTVAIGTSAGSSTTSLFAATAKATLVAGYLAPVVPTEAVPIKMTAAGNITFTIAGADITLTGVIEVFVRFVVPGA